jgi:carbamoyl-phosphate synthase large subunit
MSVDIAVLPCSDYQFDLICFLKEKGHKIIGVNPLETPATKKVDDHIVLDIMDLDAVEASLRKKGVSHIMTDQCDVAVLPVAKLSERLNLPFNSVESVQRFSCNKYKMYQHAQSVGVPFGQVQRLNDPAQLELDLPIVFKPEDSANSRGVYEVHDSEDIGNQFGKSVRFSKSGYVLAQEWKTGTQITVEGICLDGKHYTLCHSYKGPYWSVAITSFVRWSLCDVLSDGEIKELERQNDFFVESTGVRDCITHAEYIYQDGVFFLNEIACRGGGFFISSLIAPHVSGVNLYELLYRKVVQGETTVPVPKRSKSAIIKFYRTPIDEVYTEGVVHVSSGFNKREFCQNGDNARVSNVVILGDSSDDLDEKIRRFESESLPDD